jgi:hypothetical protein
MKYKTGTYIFQNTPNLFEWEEQRPAQTVTTHLTESEANKLIGQKLYEKLGFEGWTFSGESNQEQG